MEITDGSTTDDEGGLSGLPARILMDEGDPVHGPTLVIFAAIHGNEQSGLKTVARLRTRLETGGIRLFGRVLAVSGNRRAIARNQRFIDRDLNRRWGAHDPGSSSTDAQTSEDLEQRELMAVVDGAVQDADAVGNPQVVLLDLHSTSGKTPAFCCLADAPGNHRLGFSLGLPVIFGLEETADGTLLGFYNDRGLPGVAVEGGQHEDPRTVERQLAAAWIMMATLGIVPQTTPSVRGAREALQAASKGRPAAVEIVHRHPVEASDEFVMVPGFASFQPVSQGTVLAHDRNGPVHCPLDGRVLLPLYQGSGEDGFFLATDLSAGQMSLLKILRQIGAERALGWLPGVREVDGQDAFEVQHTPLRHVHRRVLGLFGYRRRRDGNILARRRQLS